MISLELTQARADFTRRFAWDYWATLTYELSIPEAATDVHVRTWCRIAAADVFKSHLRTVRVSDLQDRGVMHFHFLIALTDLEARPIPMKEVEQRLHRAWRDGDCRAGFTRFARYDSQRGAAWYLARHRGDWSISEFCSRSPQCRRQRCRQVAWLTVDATKEHRVEAVGRKA